MHQGATGESIGEWSGRASLRLQHWTWDKKMDQPSHSLGEGCSEQEAEAYVKAWNEEELGPVKDQNGGQRGSRWVSQAESGMGWGGRGRKGINHGGVDGFSAWPWVSAGADGVWCIFLKDLSLLTDGYRLNRRCLNRSYSVTGKLKTCRSPNTK